jgi:hypothetical protein
MIDKIEPCALCGSEARFVGDYLSCFGIECQIEGPSSDPDAAKWNAMQRAICAGQAKEPPEGAVKVEIPIYYSDFNGGRVYTSCEFEAEGTISFCGGSFPFATITAWIVPPKVQEVEGSVEQ